MSKLTFSVIVTCYNRANTIERALLSLSRQTSENFKIVFVDDASTDESVTVVQDFSRKHPQIALQIIRHDFNLGQNAAINSALKVVDSDLIAFLDSDDKWEPEFINEMQKPFEDASVDFAYCRLVGGPKWTLHGTGIYHEVLRQGFLSPLGTLVVRSNVFRSILPLPERIFVNDMCQDDYICFELSKTFTCKHIPEELYRIIGDSNGVSITGNRRNAALGWYQFYKHYECDLVILGEKRVFREYLYRNLLVAIKAGSFSLSFDIIRDLLIRVGIFNSASTVFKVLVTMKKWR